jgi:hypothetical protein
MLSTKETDLLLRAATALRSHGEAALAEQINAALLASSATKATLSGRPRGRNAGAPRVNYMVELAPGWQSTAAGSKATHELIVATLKEHGQRGAPTVGSLAVTLSRNGQWQRLWDSADGTLALTVRKMP